MGAIKGRTYSNSLEAFKANYKKGFRLFEVDFSKTIEGKMVARHDWRESLTEIYLQTSPNDEEHLDGPWPYEYFMTQPIFEKYTPLDLDQVIGLMKKYKDMYIVTDTKDSDTENVTKEFQQIVDAAGNDEKILKRVIPQIYNQQMYADIESVYHFDEYIYTLYKSQDTEQEVIDFSVANGIKVVTMPEFKTNAEFVRKLKDQGIVSFVHTINDAEQIKMYKDLGVHGFYTDTVTYEQLNKIQ